MSRSAGSLLIAVALALALGAAPAGASTLSVELDPRCAEVECTWAAHYTTAADETTDLTVVGDPGARALALRDAGAVIDVDRGTAGPGFGRGPVYACTASGHDAACASTPGVVCFTGGCGAIFGFGRAIVDARASRGRVRTLGLSAFIRAGVGTSLVDVRSGDHDEVFCEPGNATRVLSDGLDSVDPDCAQLEVDRQPTAARARGDLLGVPYDVTVP